MHCHSTASELAKLGIQRSVGLPECATPPEEVYELAKRRGMDFVTITDHDTIDGCLEIADRPDVFISEELTAWFAGEPQAVHVLCYGITPDDHELLQAHARDLETCAAYLHEREITCALAHPFFAVAAPLTARHRRRLAELFRDLGGPQRLARARAEHAGRRLHRDPRRHRRSAAPTTTPASTSGGRGPRPRPRRRRKSFCPHPRGARRGARRAGQRRQVGARGARARDPGADPRRARRRWPPSGRSRTRRHVLKMAERVVGEGDERGGDGDGDLGAGRGPRAAPRLARLGRARRRGCPEG